LAYSLQPTMKHEENNNVTGKLFHGSTIREGIIIQTFHIAVNKSIIGSSHRG